MSFLKKLFGTSEGTQADTLSYNRKDDKLYNEFMGYYLMIGVSDGKTGDWPTLVKKGRAALSRSPNMDKETQASCYTIIGSALYESGELEAACEELERALKLNSQEYDAHRALGDVYGDRAQLIKGRTQGQYAEQLSNTIRSFLPMEVGQA